MAETAACQRCTSQKQLIDGTCFSAEELQCMVRATCVLLQRKCPTSVNSMTNQEIWTYLRALMIDQLDINNDNSWLFQRHVWRALHSQCPKLANTISLLSVRPKFTGNRRGWLSNTDIDLLMLQESQDFAKTFVFGGTYWSGHEMLRSARRPLNEVHFEQYPEKAWGVILNTASRIKGNRHWIAIFQPAKYSHIEYFDPVGRSPNSAPMLQKEIAQLKRGAPSGLVYVKRRHQFDDNSCGAYSCLFLLCRAAGQSFNMFQTNEIRECVVRDFRKQMFT